MSSYIQRSAYLSITFGVKRIAINYQRATTAQSAQKETYAIYTGQHGISEPVFYGDLAYKFKRIVGNPHFSDQFKKIIKLYNKLDITWISCTVYSYDFLFNYTTVDQASA